MLYLHKVLCYVACLLPSFDWCKNEVKTNFPCNVEIEEIYTVGSCRFLALSC